MNEMQSWSAWLSPLAWTAGTLAVAWTLGQLLRAALNARLGRRSRVERHPLVGAALETVGRRLPWLALVIGAWLAAGYWPLTAEGRVLVDRTAFVVGTVSVTFALAALASRAVDVLAAVLGPALPASSLTRNVAWGAIATIGLLIALNGIGVSITPMLTALGVGGLAVALALQEPLANFFAGLFITLAGQIRLGDYVKLDSGQEGYVADFSWRSTRLRMLANNLVVVPNAKLAQAVVINHHLPSAELAVLVELGVDYSSDLSHVERVVVEVARRVMREVPGGVPEFEPFVRFHTFGESSVDFTVILRASEYVAQYLIKHEFVKRLHERFDAEGIVIPFPIRTVAYRGAAPEAAALAPARVVPDGRPPDAATASRNA